MTQTVITNHFNAYKADCEANNKPIIMDEFVFAYVPGLDHTADIDPNENLPSNDHIVGRFPVTQKGKINQDAVVYSIILGTDVGTWKFNWVGLVNREHNFAGIIQHTREQEKTQNDPLNGQPGDSLVRNLITPYKNAAALTQINVDADVWQIDFTQRLKAMDERSRQESLCLYEHASFIGDGWKVINHNGALAAMSGRGFVGGLLCIAPQNITIPTPGAGSNVYLTAKFEGQLNGSHQVVTRIVTTTETLDDISIDGDVTTYRQKIAVFNSLSDIDDTRPIEWREKHLDTNTNPHPQYALKTDLDESTGQLQRPATTDRLGLTEIATQQEVDQDLPSDKVVTTKTLGKAALIRSLQNFATNKANEAVATVMGGITKPELDSIRELGLALEQSGDAIRSLFTQISTKLNISTFETFQTAYNQFKAQTLSRLSDIESDLPLKVAVTTFNDYKTWVQQELNKKWVAVSATVSRSGIVQLLDSVTSTSTSHAATPNSVKQANDLAKEALTVAEAARTQQEVYIGYDNKTETLSAPPLPGAVTYIWSKITRSSNLMATLDDTKTTLLIREEGLYEIEFVSLRRRHSSGSSVHTAYIYNKTNELASATTDSNNYSSSPATARWVGRLVDGDQLKFCATGNTSMPGSHFTVRYLRP